MAFGAPLRSIQCNATNSYYPYAWQVLREAAVGLAVGEEVAVVAVIVEAEEARGVDVRDFRLKPDLQFYSY